MLLGASDDRDPARHRHHGFWAARGSSSRGAASDGAHASAHVRGKPMAHPGQPRLPLLQVDRFPAGGTGASGLLAPARRPIVFEARNRLGPRGWRVVTFRGNLRSPRRLQRPNRPTDSRRGTWGAGGPRAVSLRSPRSNSGRPRCRVRPRVGARRGPTASGTRWLVCARTRRSRPFARALLLRSPHSLGSSPAGCGSRAQFDAKLQVSAPASKKILRRGPPLQFRSHRSAPTSVEHAGIGAVGQV